jgi:hypothetical protein
MTDRHDSLLARRIPRESIVPGRAYRIHARNGGIGIAEMDQERLGYVLHRVKFGSHFLFVEWDWEEGVPYGTAIPLVELTETPPTDRDCWLDWLSQREIEHKETIQATWTEILLPR